MHKTDNRYEHVHAWVRFKRQVTRAGRSNTCLDNSRKQGCANDCGESQYGQNGERLASGLPAAWSNLASCLSTGIAVPCLSRLDL